MANSEVQTKLQELKEMWEYDEDILARIDGDVQTIRRYVTVRQAHEELSQAPKDEYDSIAVSVADSKRTAAHNRAIRAAADLNKICKVSGVEPIAPTCPKGVDPYGIAHRTSIANFAYAL